MCLLRRRSQCPNPNGRCHARVPDESPDAERQSARAFATHMYQNGRNIPRESWRERGPQGWGVKIVGSRSAKGEDPVRRTAFNVSAWISKGSPELPHQRGCYGPVSFGFDAPSIAGPCSNPMTNAAADTQRS